MSLLSPHHVQEGFGRAYQQCYMDNDVLPKASAYRGVPVDSDFTPVLR